MDRQKLYDSWQRMKKGTVIAKYLSQSKGEVDKIDAYVWAIFNGQNPTAPILASDFGAGYVGTIAAGMTEVAPSPQPSSPRAGFSSHVMRYADKDAYVARLASAGAKVIRDDLNWSGMEPTKGNFNFSAADTICNLARKYNMKFIAMIGYSPAWANGNKQDKVGPLDPNDFGNWAGKIAGYLATNHADVTVGIEYWNEPNITFLINPTTGKVGDPVYYASLAKAAYPKMKAAAPNIPVWGGSTAGVGSLVWNEHTPQWTEAALNAGTPFDEWSCHPYYWDTNLTGAQMAGKTTGSDWSRVFWWSGGETLAAQLARHGYTGPIHGTECGGPTNPPGGTCPRGTSEQALADWWDLAWPLWKSESRAGYLCIYTGQDSNTNDTTDYENHFGAFRTDNSAKPIVARMKASSLA